MIDTKDLSVVRARQLLCELEDRRWKIIDDAWIAEKRVQSDINVLESFLLGK